MTPLFGAVGFNLAGFFSRKLALNRIPDPVRPTSVGWLRDDTVVERLCLTGELSLSCARPTADG